MKNFIFKSSDPDLQKIFQSLDTLQKNVLYVTHAVDRLNKNVLFILNNSKLQKQVDEYFDENTENIPEDSDGNSTS